MVQNHSGFEIHKFSGFEIHATNSFSPLRGRGRFGIIQGVAVLPLREAFGGFVRLRGLARKRREGGVLQLPHKFCRGRKGEFEKSSAQGVGREIGPGT